MVPGFAAAVCEILHFLSPSFFSFSCPESYYLVNVKMSVIDPRESKSTLGLVWTEQMPLSIPPAQELGLGPQGKALLGFTVMGDGHTF